MLQVIGSVIQVFRCYAHFLRLLSCVPCTYYLVSPWLPLPAIPLNRYLYMLRLLSSRPREVMAGQEDYWLRRSLSA